MKANDCLSPDRPAKLFGRIYVLLFAAMAFTGFGQMPIFKRYYLADIPGLAWSADYYFTHMLHYVGACLLLSLITYLACDYLLFGRKQFVLTKSAYIRIALLAGIICTGVFRVLKNLPDVVFSPAFTLFIDVTHLGLMMLYVAMAVIFFLWKSPYLVNRH